MTVLWQSLRVKLRNNWIKIIYIQYINSHTVFNFITTHFCTPLPANKDPIHPSSNKHFLLSCTTAAATLTQSKKNAFWRTGALTSLFWGTPETMTHHRSTKASPGWQRRQRGSLRLDRFFKASSRIKTRFKVFGNNFQEFENYSLKSCHFRLLNCSWFSELQNCTFWLTKTQPLRLDLAFFVLFTYLNLSNFILKLHNFEYKQFYFF